MNKFLITIITFFFVACGSSSDKPSCSVEDSGDTSDAIATTLTDDDDVVETYYGQEYCEQDEIQTQEVGDFKLCIKTPMRMRFGPDKENSIEFTVVKVANFQKVRLNNLVVQPWMKHCCGSRPIQEDIAITDDVLEYNVSNLFYNKPSHHKWVMVITFDDPQGVNREFEVEIPYVDR